MSTAPSRSRHPLPASSEATQLSLAADASALYRDLKIATEYRPIESLRSYPNNPRTHSPQQIAALTDSLRAFGFVTPVLVDEHDVVIGGHGVLAAAKHAGYAEVPTIRLTHLSEPQKKALRIGLNRLAEDAGWDRNLLALEFSTLLEIDNSLTLDFGLTITGFSMPEIDRIVEDTKNEGANDDELVEAEAASPTVSRLGDLWICGEHRLINGDACSPATYRALLGDERAAMGLHDAPYNLSVTKHVSKSGRHREFVMGVGELSEAEFTSFLTRFLSHAVAHSRPGAVQLSFIDWRHIREMHAAGEAVGLELVNLAVWNKGVGAMGSLYRSQHELVFVFADPRGPMINNVQLGRFGRNRTNVWSWPGAASLRKELKLHPTPKPVGLLAEAIRDVSHRGDIVLDSFSGSGSTIIAAAKTGRRGYAIELDPRYVDVGVTRWQRWSGGTARHAETGQAFEEVKASRAREMEAAAAELGMAPTAPVPSVRVRQRPRAA